MRNLSSKFRHEMYYNHTFDCLAEITLTDNTILSITNTKLWTGGFNIDDSVSQDSSFTSLGAAVIGSASIIIDNMDESYSEYDFTNAKVNLSLSKTYEYNGTTTVEPIQMGVYTVDDTQYNGATITLSLLDNMEQFDRPYNTNLQYPATLITIVEDTCLKCGVTLLTLTFPHQDYIVQTKPDKDNVTYRQVISWAATIAGCFARCDAYGRLELKWFDTSLIDAHTTGEGLDGGEFDSSTPYSTGDTADGGSFNPWNTGYVIDDGSFETVRQLHYLTRLFSQSIGVDDVVITGVRVVVEEENSTTEQLENKEYLTGTDDYVIEVSGNEFITSSTAQSISTWLGNQLIGLRFRNGSVTHINDPSIEAGDVAIVVDRKGREYPFLVTRTSFSASGNQITECNAESASRNSATQFSQVTKAYVKARKLLNKEQTVREQAIQALSESLAQKSGLYSTVDTTQSGNIYYLHDKPLLADSKIVWKMTSNAFGVTTNYNGSDPSQTVWNAGLTVDGTLIASIIQTIKIDFDRGTGGTLTLGGQNNVNGLLRMLDANGNQVGEWKNTGLTAKSLTADDYLYVDGNNNSFFRIPLYPYDGNHYFQISDGGIEIHNYASMWDINPKTPADAIITMGASYTNRTRTDVPPIKIVKVSSGNYVYIYPESIHIYDAPDQSDSTDTQTDTYKSQLLASRLQLENLTTGASSAITSEGVSAPEIDVRDYTTNSSYRQGGKILLFGSSSNQGKLQMNLADIEFNQSGNINDVQSISCNSLRCSSLTVTGTKPRLVETKDYGERYLYCYETPTPMFGDIGEGIIGEDGLAYIQLDPTFLETVATTQYQIFLQSYGNGKVYVKERHESYFVVSGTVGLAFGWEIKAKQQDYENYRLEKETGESKIKSTDYGLKSEEDKVIDSTNYGDMAVEHIEDIAKERKVAA